jgi:NADH kinase
MVLRRIRITIWRRGFSSSARRLEIRDVESLEDRIIPKYLGKTSCYNEAFLTSTENPTSDLISLQWPSPPRNILMIKKDGTPGVTESLIEYARYRLP